MKKYYWSTEEQKIVTIDELRKNHDLFYPDIDFSDFLFLCSYTNNGIIQPLTKEITREKALVHALQMELYDFADDTATKTAIENEITAINTNINKLSAMAIETA